MMLKEGDKMLVAQRRLFPRDQPRFFVGQVDAYEAGIVKATGHTFARDSLTGDMLEKVDPRTKLISLSSGTPIVYQLPEQFVLESVDFLAEDGRLILTDGQGFVMNLSEFRYARSRQPV
jgi:hypothetical protein